MSVRREAGKENEVATFEDGEPGERKKGFACWFIRLKSLGKGIYEIARLTNWFELVGGTVRKRKMGRL